VPPDERQYSTRSSSEVRGSLLRLTLAFVRAARQIPGVRRIALLGSLATLKPRPKDADVLVTIRSDTALETLARCGRQLKGGAQSAINSTADVFLASEPDHYLGRVCEFRTCFPRVRCHARHCGRRPHLRDDLDVLMLEPALIANPPLLLYPVLQASAGIPPDVHTLLIDPLRAEQAHAIQLELPDQALQPRSD
jgi:hypothetical protein